MPAGGLMVPVTAAWSSSRCSVQELHAAARGPFSADGIGATAPDVRPGQQPAGTPASLLLLGWRNDTLALASRTCEPSAAMDGS